ncbi:zinc finger homeobox protein 3 [Hyalella azteca]|uniref:Zinc finger homeobox protein 3 n=1 Tax=Hyalella azteca TaxID=294128 RepID=A0A8B7N2L8_HYAAZ|nr:zinc finger homeobox protein 3 [Hyalella azteca]
MVPSHGGQLFYALPALPRRSDSGRDNPFRPDGDIWREADAIVQRIKSGQPLLNGGDEPGAGSPSPPPTHSSPTRDSPSPVPEQAVTRTDAGLVHGGLPSSQNGTPNPSAATQQQQQQNKQQQEQTVEVTLTTLPPPQPAAAPQHVVLKKESKCACCVIQ